MVAKMPAFKKKKVIYEKLVFVLLIVSSSLVINAQLPAIGTIDFYGLRTVSEKQIREKLQIKEGDQAPKSVGEMAEVKKRLQTLPYVEESRLNTVCCDNDGQTILYVGIREKGSPQTEYRPAPSGAVRLADDIVKIGEELEAAREKAVLKGDAAEDRGAGHSLMNNAEARAIQQKFISIAGQNLNLLRKVLRESSEAKHRALAAEIIAYYEDKSAIVSDLVSAVKDPHGAVRNNAMRALGLIAGYAQNQTKSKIKVPFDPFIEMLGSIEWSDRNKSALVLGELTAGRDPALIRLLGEKAFRSLVEMARWKDDGHAYMSFFILGRVGNLPEEEIGRIWLTGKREDLIRKIQNNIKPKSRPENAN